MKKTDMIILENQDKFTLISEIEKEGNKYFLAGKLDENDNLDTKSYQVFKAIKTDDGEYVETIVDEKLLEILLKEFQDEISN